MFESKGIINQLTTVQNLPIGIKEAWGFFSNPKNLANITPDKLKFKIISSLDAEIYPGQIIQYKVQPLPLYNSYWVTEITYMEKEKYFVDEQRFGPYAFWHHKHFFNVINGGVEMTDIVDYKIPFGWLGKLLFGRLIRSELKKIFNYRNQKLVELFGKYK